ncbi:forkhead box protein R1 isoform X2 [Anoplopoma fimbria]|uniref:forkhead box protein R1 isoform X2 n=1 Tax=Anoplopoma fimbria TaxID=229290 RepID=UPI0023EC1FD2|nr:forkhead box protein R1 isoform X2 [Anoplopoma fimbria]
MSLQLKTKAGLFGLHCSVGLTDWDMDKELKLATTTDQFYHDTFVKPNLWLLVNPSIACPIRYGGNAAGLQRVCEPAEGIQPAAETQKPLTTEIHMSVLHGAALQEDRLHSTDYMINDEDVSRLTAKNRRKGRTPRARDSKTLKPGCWPRPPVNYCILIALALKSSHTGSLKVQQIYNFTREHFPFFQTAPDGWKNTIRHNLCFNSSFRKTCNQLCRDGKRKSCFWHLTLEGHRRLKDEIHTLTGESFKQLERSMSRPDVIQSLFAL